MSERTPPDEDRAVDEEGREFIARRHHFPANGTGFLMAPLLWFAWFLAMYAIQGAACGRGPDSGSALGTSGPGTDALQFLLALLTLITAVAIVVLGVWSFRTWRRLLEELEEEERQRHGHSTFLSYGALLHAGLFLVATLWIGIPILFLDPCGP